MISGSLRITLCIAVICYFLIIIYYLNKRMLELKYTLIWLIAGVVMGIMVFFPQLLVNFVKLMGIETHMNGLYLICLAFIIAILMSLTSIASRTSMKMRALVQEIAMLEKRVRELEEANNHSNNESNKE